MILALLLAVTLQFTDTSGIEKGFVVFISKADGSERFEKFPGSPGAVSVTINLPNDGAGDCFQVAAFDRAVSSWSNVVCLPSPTPNAPANAVAKP